MNQLTVSLDNTVHANPVLGCFLLLLQQIGIGSICKIIMVFFTINETQCIQLDRPGIKNLDRFLKKYPIKREHVSKYLTVHNSKSKTKFSFFLEIYLPFQKKSSNAIICLTTQKSLLQFHLTSYPSFGNAFLPISFDKRFWTLLEVTL